MERGKRSSQISRLVMVPHLLATETARHEIDVLFLLMSRAIKKYQVKQHESISDRIQHLYMLGEFMLRINRWIVLYNIIATSITVFITT